jgi:peptide deformylase
VAQSLRLFVARLDEEPVAGDDPDAPKPPETPGLGRTHVMINPKITRFFGEAVVGTEACLSIPEYMGDVSRAYGIIIKYLDRHGQKRKLRTHGWMARVLQHEYDHLDGVLFIDKAAKVWRAETEDKTQTE